MIIDASIAFGFIIVAMKGLEEQQSQRMALERRLEQMWRQLHENCVENGELDDQLWTIYANLKRKDLLAANDISALEKRLEQLNRASAVFTQKIKTEQSESAVEMQRLVQYRTSLHDRREQMREKLRIHQKRSTELLKAVCASSSETVQVSAYWSVKWTRNQQFNSSCVAVGVRNLSAKFKKSLIYLRLCRELQLFHDLQAN